VAEAGQRSFAGSGGGAKPFCRFFYFKLPETIKKNKKSITFRPCGYLYGEISPSDLTTVQKTADFFFFYTSPRIIIYFCVHFAGVFISKPGFQPI